MIFPPFPGVSELVTRHRGGGRDEDGDLIEAPADEDLPTLVIAPGGGSENVDRLREGETIACTVYFQLGTDVVNSDELTVRGERFSVLVNDWHMNEFGGLEVLCTRGQG